MINADVIITERGIRKLSSNSYDQVASQVVKQVGDEMYTFITNGGTGVRFLGYNPEGGAPVWEDDPKLLEAGQKVGELRDSHIKRHDGNQYTIGSNSPYVLPVILGIRSDFWVTQRGSSRTASPPKENHYHKRAIDETIKDNGIKDNVEDVMSREKLI